MTQQVVKVAPKVIKVAGKFLKKYLPLILSGVTAAGIVTTPILAVKASKKADDIRKKRKVEPKSKVDDFIEVMPAYKWAILSGALSLTTLGFSSGILWVRSAKAMISLEKTSAQLANAQKAVLAAGGAGILAADKIKPSEIPEEMKTKVIESKKDQDADDLMLFYDVVNDHYFTATEKDVLWSMYYSLGFFTTNGFLTVDDFYSSMGCDGPDDKVGWGWEIDDDWISEWEDTTIEFGYEQDPVIIDDNGPNGGLEVHYFYFHRPPKFYEDLYYNNTKHSVVSPPHL